MKTLTPLVALTPYDRNIYAKLEYVHPSGSMKHRAIPKLVQELIQQGEISRGQRIAIRSAGSAAVALAWAGAQFDCPVTAVLPPSAMQATASALRWLGAEILQVPPIEATALMEAFEAEPGTYVLAQANESRLIDYYEAVACEIFQEIQAPAAITVGIGTGLSVMGIEYAARKLGHKCQVWGVEPAEAAIASGQPWAPHRIPGLAPPIPQPLLDISILDGVIPLPSAEAWLCAREIAQQCGLLVGPSSGATIAAASRLRKQGINGHIVAICACAMNEYWEETTSILNQSTGP